MSISLDPSQHWPSTSSSSSLQERTQPWPSPPPSLSEPPRQTVSEGQGQAQGQTQTQTLLQEEQAQADQAKAAENLAEIQLGRTKRFTFGNGKIALKDTLVWLAWVQFGAPPSITITTITPLSTANLCGALVWIAGVCVTDYMRAQAQGVSYNRGFARKQDRAFSSRFAVVVVYAYFG